jgi:hypothetical protein
LKFNYHKAGQRQRLNPVGRKTNASEQEDDLRPEYDFSKMKSWEEESMPSAIALGTNLLLLARDLRKAFPDDKMVNEALRMIARIAKDQTAGDRKARGRKQASRSQRAA